MTFNTAVALLVLPALTLGAVYFPLLRRVPPGVESPYGKAHMGRRLVAALVDGSLVAAAARGGTPWSLLVAAAYVALRDALGGRSVGKFCVGLVVVRPGTGKPCSVRDSLTRNLVFVFPGADVVAAVLESVTMSRDPYGYRLGDRIAGTQVVEGFGARDLATSFLRSWWNPAPRRRGRRRQPVRVPR